MLSAVEVRVTTADDAVAVAAVHGRSWHNAYGGLLPDAYLDGVSVERRRGHGLGSAAPHGARFGDVYETRAPTTRVRGEQNVTVDALTAGDSGHPPASRAARDYGAAL